MVLSLEGKLSWAAFPVHTSPQSFGKKYNFWLRLAHSEMFKLNYGSRDDRLDTINRILAWSRNYRKDVGRKAIILKNLFSNELKIIPYYTRFDDGYYRKWEKRMRKFRPKNAIFITITVDPAKCLRFVDCRDSLTNGWHHMNMKYRERFGHFDFVRSVEIGENGNLHMHILIPFKYWVEPVHELSRYLEEKGLGKVVWIEKIKNDPRKVAAYMGKYLFKSVKDDRTKALLWALRMRAFAFSRGLLTLLDNHKNNFYQSADLKNVWIYYMSIPVHSLLFLPGIWIGSTVHEHDFWRKWDEFLVNS